MALRESPSHSARALGVHSLPCGSASPVPGPGPPCTPTKSSTRVALLSSSSHGESREGAGEARICLDRRRPSRRAEEDVRSFSAALHVAQRRYSRQAWSILSLPLSLIATHCSIRCRFVGLANRHATMRSSPTRCVTTAAQSSPGLHSHLEAHRASPAERSASRVLGNAAAGVEYSPLYTYDKMMFFIREVVHHHFQAHPRNK